VDEIGERYWKIPITVEQRHGGETLPPLYSFPRDVRLSHRCIVTFSALSDFFIILPYKHS